MRLTERLPIPGRTIVSVFFVPCGGPARLWPGTWGGSGFFSGGTPIKSNRVTRVNRMIRIPRVLVVDEEGEQLGVLETREALAIAEERGLDLVEVAPTARPPVCRIMDYGKFKYEQSKKARKARQASHTVKVKTVQFRPKTDDHDYEFKKKHIVSFLEAGNKVKVVMRFRGREFSHIDLALVFLENLVDEIEEYGTPESRPQREGRQISFIMAPKKKKEV
ncbi:translation initiation factor IF-3 [bacterium]|nr:MAG: translation initiation factor IF-3 [bacterium]